EVGEDGGRRGLHRCCRLTLAQAGQAQCERQRGAGGVGPAAPGDVGGGAVDRLGHARRGALDVEVAARGHAQSALEHRTQVGDDVAEEVVGDDDVEALGGHRQVHAHGVDVDVVVLDTGKAGRDLVDHVGP